MLIVLELGLTGAALLSAWIGLSTTSGIVAFLNGVCAGFVLCLLVSISMSPKRSLPHDAD